jgi:3,4-dihydroxy 2-butanone 4-phosphate synthase/GTP cyclohydrolase II
MCIKFAYHIKMCEGADMSTLERVRSLVTDGEISKAGLARAAGLHANTLRDCTEASWNPTTETVAKLEAFLNASDDRPALVGAEEIINEARNGRMYILVDDEDRENEGDLIIPAQMATPDAINFMATHGRGLICLALDRARVETLGLEPMARDNRESMQTAFTTSIEAREGVTTGISAADRARTVAVAIDAMKGPQDIVTPGHVFPLTARDGGVLVRAGHTEAAVDISRLAGLNPSGVICEIMNDDGTMARLDDLIGFARKHDLKIGTIRDLIEYRMRHDHLVKHIGESDFTSDYGGAWRMLTYRNTVDGSESYVLQKGRVTPGEATLTRVHPISIFDDLLGQPGPRKRTLQRAMQVVGEHGSGVIVLITGRPADPDSYSAEDEVRNVGIGSQILADLGVEDMILLSNSQPHLVAIGGYGLNIIDHKPIPE